MVSEGDVKENGFLACFKSGGMSMVPAGDGERNATDRTIHSFAGVKIDALE